MNLLMGLLILLAVVFIVLLILNKRSNNAKAENKILKETIKDKKETLKEIDNAIKNNGKVNPDNINDLINKLP